MKDATSNKAQLEEAARLVCCAAYAAYMATLRGDVPAGSHKNFEAVVGTTVFECMMFRMKKTGILDCIGVLERMEHEPFCTEEHWRDPVNGHGALISEPVPTEKVWYIRTLDGREVRWTNALFVRVPDSPDFQVMNPIGATARHASQATS